MKSQHDNKFVARIYEESEDKLWHAFQIDFNKLKTVLDRPEDDDHGPYSVEEKLRASFEEGGAVQLRHHICVLLIPQVMHHLQEEHLTHLGNALQKDKQHHQLQHKVM